MADTFTWGVANLRRELADGTVTTIDWTLTAERTVSGETLTAGSYGSVGLGAPDPNNFIDYDNLTPQIVEGWTIDALGEDQVVSMKAGLTSQLNVRETPTEGFGVPW